MKTISAIILISILGTGCSGVPKKGKAWHYEIEDKRVVQVIGERLRN